MANRRRLPVPETLVAAPASDLRAEVQSLRADLDELRRQLATEVRTRRLVVVDETGFERVTTTVGEQYCELAVNARVDNDDRPTRALLYASEESGPDVALYLMADGNPTAVLSALNGGELGVSDADGHEVLTVGRNGLTVKACHTCCGAGDSRRTADRLGAGLEQLASARRPGQAE